MRKQGLIKYKKYGKSRTYWPIQYWAIYLLFMRGGWRLCYKSEITKFISRSLLIDSLFKSEKSILPRPFTKREDEVMKAYHFGKLSERGIAKKLKISRSTVRSYRQNALCKIDRFFLAFFEDRTLAKDIYESIRD